MMNYYPFFKFVKAVIRNLIFDEQKRVDGRAFDALRPISCKINMYNSLHGSALFQRGQTQVLASVTFDSPDSMYRADSVAQMMSPSLTNFHKNFMLHYEFPSFATNEIARIGGRADRREIGHGALAEKGVYPVFPDAYDLTVRSLCEVLESNGSSSMASVCATSLALMDAGVPIKEPGKKSLFKKSLR
jgi:polyribonucleotide nucleotidyltransferase